MSTLGRLRSSTVEEPLPDTDTDTDTRSGARPAAPAPAPRRGVPRFFWFCAALAVVIVAVAAGARVVLGGVSDLNPFKNGIVQQRTVDRSGPAVLKAVTDLGTLQSASGYYEIVIDVQKSVDFVPSFVTGRRVLFVAAGTVDAGIDLKTLGAGAVTVDDARTTATVRLPRPRLSTPRLDIGRSYVYAEDRGLVDRLGDAFSGSSQEQKKLYTLASQRLAQAASANDELVNRAEASARAVLQSLLRPLGLTEVTVTFD